MTATTIGSCSATKKNQLTIIRSNNKHSLALLHFDTLVSLSVLPCLWYYQHGGRRRRYYQPRTATA